MKKNFNFFIPLLRNLEFRIWHNCCMANILHFFPNSVSGCPLNSTALCITHVPLKSEMSLCLKWQLHFKTNTHQMEFFHVACYCASPCILHYFLSVSSYFLDSNLGIYTCGSLTNITIESEDICGSLLSSSKVGFQDKCVACSCWVRVSALILLRLFCIM